MRLYTTVILEALYMIYLLRNYLCFSFFFHSRSSLLVRWSFHMLQPSLYQCVSSFPWCNWRNWFLKPNAELWCLLGLFFASGPGCLAIENFKLILVLKLLLVLRSEARLKATFDSFPGITWNLGCITSTCFQGLPQRCVYRWKLQLACEYALPLGLPVDPNDSLSMKIYAQRKTRRRKLARLQVFLLPMVPCASSPFSRVSWRRVAMENGKKAISLY